MRSKSRGIICIISLIISILGVKCEVCSANVDPSPLYQETIRLSLDVFPERTEQIDQIITELNNQLKSSQEISKFKKCLIFWSMPVG
ncbi:MAG TPA: hypothetical protein VGL27_15000 [Negativicutes bacterium]|jgi:hypothetical protein